jgi:thiamine biosynthesis lipoprotein
VVAGPVSLIDHARRRIAALEDRWTRFRSSELTDLNALSGEPVGVSRETFDLVHRSVVAWRRTGGRFDPTVLGAVIRAGYGTSFEALAGGAACLSGAPLRTPGCAGVRLDRERLTVMLPPGAAIDPGGIGKGFAADIVTRELMARGATGTLVGIGGDLRVRGEPSPGRRWTVSLMDPRRREHEIARIALTGGGVATSSVTLRRWPTADGEAHHIIDPALGRPATTAVAGACVVAGACWWAEAVATAIVAGGAPADLQRLPRASALVVEHGGAMRATPDLIRMMH